MASTNFIDSQVGRILEALGGTGRTDDTIVVVWSDHGYHFGEKGHWGKHTLWERTTHVPHIWAGPGIPSNTLHKFPVSALDIYPTLVEMCDLKIEQKLDGKSMVEIFNNPKKDFNRIAITPGIDGKGFTVVNKNWRYIIRTGGEEELYD